MQLQPMSRSAALVADVTSAAPAVRENSLDVCRRWLRTHANARVLHSLDASGSVTRSLACFGQAIGCAVRALARVRRHAYGRHCLATADARLLADLGVSRAQAQYRGRAPRLGPAFRLGEVAISRMEATAGNC